MLEMQTHEDRIQQMSQFEAKLNSLSQKMAGFIENDWSSEREYFAFTI